MRLAAAVLIISSVGLCIGRIGLWGDGTGFIAKEYFEAVESIGIWGDGTGWFCSIGVFLTPH